MHRGYSHLATERRKRRNAPYGRDTADGAHRARAAGRRRPPEPPPSYFQRPAARKRRVRLRGRSGAVRRSKALYLLGVYISPYRFVQQLIIADRQSRLPISSTTSLQVQVTNHTNAVYSLNTNASTRAFSLIRPHESGAERRLTYHAPRQRLNASMFPVHPHIPVRMPIPTPDIPPPRPTPACAHASPPPTGSEILRFVRARAPRIVLSRLHTVDTGLHSARAHVSVHVAVPRYFESFRARRRSDTARGPNPSSLSLASF
ncbi:hypothetical protein BJ912DRAFT_982904 [Pholiota molesta]|nr:hypothetical protein BJ912DRAFT_982904 [Pholiota molesta]